MFWPQCFLTSSQVSNASVILQNYEQFFVYLVDRIIGTPATSCVEEEDEADRNGRSETVTAANSTASGSISADLRHSLLSSKSSEETSDDEACNPELKTPVKTLEWLVFIFWKANPTLCRILSFHLLQDSWSRRNLRRIQKDIVLERYWWRE